VGLLGQRDLVGEKREEEVGQAGWLGPAREHHKLGLPWGLGLRKKRGKRGRLAQETRMVFHL
jgi:hypothetical protein